MLFESYDFDSLPATVVDKTHGLKNNDLALCTPSKQGPKLACDVYFLFQLTEMLFRIFLYTLLCNFLSGQLSLVSASVP